MRPCAPAGAQYPAHRVFGRCWRPERTLCRAGLQAALDIQRGPRRQARLLHQVLWLFSLYTQFIPAARHLEIQQCICLFCEVTTLHICRTGWYQFSDNRSNAVHKLSVRSLEDTLAAQNALFERNLIMLIKYCIFLQYVVQCTLHNCSLLVTGLVPGILHPGLDLPGHPEHLSHTCADICDPLPLRPHRARLHLLGHPFFVSCFRELSMADPYYHSFCTVTKKIC